MDMVKELASATGHIPTLEEFFKATAIHPHTFYNENIPMPASWQMPGSFPISR